MPLCFLPLPTSHEKSLAIALLRLTKFQPRVFSSLLSGPGVRESKKLNHDRTITLLSFKFARAEGVGLPDEVGAPCAAFAERGGLDGRADWDVLASAAGGGSRAVPADLVGSVSEDRVNA
jgi:hypothetical protein